ncbi:hypothetical protein Pmani_034492 [Petrolisthes manimaculis]|uniref:Uncharacterized protein n=1 Tax=Petrolisthes manimaculis TaxID=1843537 RepID=A0AAE1NME7_9EUCA|nr:hypothetical protein Pmani_034492 [Petrolisthes manimaculis]
MRNITKRNESQRQPPLTLLSITFPPPPPPPLARLWRREGGRVTPYLYPSLPLQYLLTSLPSPIPLVSQHTCAGSLMCRPPPIDGSRGPPATFPASTARHPLVLYWRGWRMGEPMSCRAGVDVERTNLKSLWIDATLPTQDNELKSAEGDVMPQDETP